MAGKTILIVDDTPNNLRLAIAILKHEGYQIQTAEDGIQALDILRTSPRPDLILSDIQMPNMDGLELARVIKQDSRWSEIPVLALTAYAAQVNQQQAIEAGFDGYLTKPVNTTALRKRIREYLENG